MDLSTDTMEIRIPWDLINNLTGPPDMPLRFSVMVCRADSSGDCEDLSGTSDALDVVSNYGEPGQVDVSRDTSTEFSSTDDVLDYHFEVWFDVASGEVYAPVVVSEVFAIPQASPDQEFVELANVSPLDIDLRNWKVGDEEEPGGGEGMYSFGAPGPGSAALGSVEPVVIALDGVAFANNFTLFLLRRPVRRHLGV